MSCLWISQSRIVSCLWMKRCNILSNTVLYVSDQRILYFASGCYPAPLNTLYLEPDFVWTINHLFWILLFFDQSIAQDNSWIEHIGDNLIVRSDPFSSLITPITGCPTFGVSVVKIRISIFKYTFSCWKQKTPWFFVPWAFKSKATSVELIFFVFFEASFNVLGFWIYIINIL